MSIVSDIVVALSAIFVSIVAWLGLRIWRKELTGKAKFDIAQRGMLLASKVNAGFQSARFPLMSSIEYSGRVREPSEPPKVAQVSDERYAKANRLRPLQEDLLSMQQACWEAEVLLEEDKSQQMAEALGAYKGSYGELASAVDSYFDVRRKEEHTGSMIPNQEFLRELKKVIYSSGQDEFSRRVEEATAKMKRALQAYVR